MFSVLKSWATAGVAATAFVMALGFALQANNAEARPVFAKYEGVDGEAARDGTASKRAAVQKRVSVAQMRRILRKAKRSGARSSNLAQKRTPPPPPPPGRPGSLSSGGPGGGVSPGITCDALGLCLCNGAEYCNVLIAACVEAGGHLYCGTHDNEGRPISCSCLAQ